MGIRWIAIIRRLMVSWEVLINTILFPQKFNQTRIRGRILFSRCEPVGSVSYLDKTIPRLKFHRAQTAVAAAPSVLVDPGSVGLDLSVYPPE